MFQNINKQGIFQIILLVGNITLLIHLFIISYHATIFVDDFCFMGTYKKYGTLGNVYHYYMTWQGRFAPYFLLTLVLKFYEWTGTAFPYFFLLICIYVLSIARILKITLSGFITDIKTYELINVSTAIFSFFVVLSFDISTFFWINASTVYYLGIGLSLLIAAIIVTPTKNLLSIVGLVIACIYTGASAEHFSAICILLLGLAIAIRFYQCKMDISALFKDVVNIKIIIALICFIVSFLIMISAPGANVRRGHFPESSLISAFPTALKSLNYLLLTSLKDKYKFLAVLAMLSFFFGTLISLDKKKFNIKHLSLALIAFLSFLYVCLIPMAYAVSSIGPYRSLNHITLFLIVFVVAIAFYGGRTIQIPNFIQWFLGITGGLAFIVITCQRLITQVPDTVQLAQKQRERIDYLQHLKPQSKIIELNKMPIGKGNILKYTELSEDPDNWQNKCICEGLELDYKIKLKGKKK